MRLHKHLIIIALISSVPLQAREVIGLNDGWQLFAEGDTMREAVSVCLPHDYQISQPWVEPAADEKADLKNAVANITSRLSARGFKEMGRGLYRKTLFVPESWRGKRVLLDFEGIMFVGDAFLNGKTIGNTDYGYLGFEADISDKLKYGEENIIEVLADTQQPDNSRWYTGGGLYRDVNIILSEKDLHFGRHPFYIQTPEIQPEKANIVISSEIFSSAKSDKSLQLDVEIFAPDGKSVLSHSQQIKRRHKLEEYPLDTLQITSPLLWDCENPNLYTAVFKLRHADGSPADSLSQRFGIRSLEYTTDHGLLLNGKKVLLKGLAGHHTLGPLGAAAHPDAIRKQLRFMKEWGMNHIRTSHNPYSQSLMDMCDEMGILVVDELYDKWLTKYAGGRRDWLAQYPEDIAEFIKRDRNHPSVVMWSLGNELQTLWDIPFHDYGVTPYRMQKPIVQRFDRTRPLTVAMHPRGRSQLTDSIPAALALETDIASYNYRFMYFPGDARRFPDMKFYLSEASTSRLAGSWFGMDREKVIGLAYWGAIDYLGESQGWPAKGWDKGVFDITLNPKPQAWLLRSLFREEEPTVHIGILEATDGTVWNDVKVGTDRLVDHWNFPKGSFLTINTFTNGDEVELRINGRSLGRRPNPVDDFEKRNTIVWDSIPYNAGKIEAIAFNGGKEIARHKIETAGKAVKLRATVEKGENGVDYVNIEAVDKKGRIVPYADDLLTFTLEGPGEILAVANGDMNSEESYVGTTRRLFQGRAQVIIRTTSDKPAARPKLRITSHSLPTCLIKF